MSAHALHDHDASAGGDAWAREDRSAAGETTMATAGASRRVLMLCYLFPPIRSAGTHRSVAFATGLPAAGWRPTVLTVSRHRDRSQVLGEPVPTQVDVVRAPELDLVGVLELLQGVTNRLCRLWGGELPAHYFRDRLATPDPQRAWLARWKARHVAPAVDCIYASCSPFSAAIAAVKLGRTFGKPVVLDFRDAWLLNPHNPLSGRRRERVARLEAEVIAGATRLILNTEGAGRLYRQAYPQHASKMVVIPNGYDALQASAGRAVRSGEFRIVHVGSFYGRRSAAALFEALARLNRRNVVFVHAGPPLPDLDHYPGVTVRQLGMVSREQAQQALQDASLLYLKQAHEAGVTDYIAVASKTYEYLATGLPVLADCPEGDNAEIVRRYCRAPLVVTSGRSEDLEAALRQAIDSREHLPVGVSPEFVLAFDRRRLTDRLAQVLNDAVGAGRSS